MEETLMHAIEPAAGIIAFAVDLFGIGLILIGAAKFAVRSVLIEAQKLGGAGCYKAIRDNRLELGGYILAGLEFMIVSDILHSVVSRTLDDFLLLGILVIIRTSIGFFLGLELKEIERNSAAT